jgi:hypothetical protein
LAQKNAIKTAPVNLPRIYVGYEKESISHAVKNDVATKGLYWAACAKDFALSKMDFRNISRCLNAFSNASILTGPNPRIVIGNVKSSITS